MGIVKKNWPWVVKVVSFAIFVIYVIVGKSSIGTHYPTPIKGEGYGDTASKVALNGWHCMVLLGGSNVRQGLEAGLMTQGNCTAVNLGVAAELGTFEQYLAWLKQSRVSAAKAVYSPAAIWNDSSTIEFADKSGMLDFSITPLGSQIQKNFFSYRKKNNFDLNGDITNSVCEGRLGPMVLDTAGFRKANESVAIAIQLRIATLKTALGTNEVYLRIPPIYTSQQWVQTYHLLINERQLILKRKGVNVIPQEVIVSSDKSLFCENIHPNKVGRIFFTEQLKLKLPS